MATPSTSQQQQKPQPAVEEATKGKAAYGTHDYPDPLTHIDRVAWDVVIVGAGPAGLMLATSLARFGGLNILVIDERSEPTIAGRADGIQPRVRLEIVLRERDEHNLFPSLSARS